MLKGREREGKTGALFSIALAAIILRMRVVILCDRTKWHQSWTWVKKIHWLWKILECTSHPGKGDPGQRLVL